jgi:N-acetylneuraminic acid mutarotase
MADETAVRVAGIESVLNHAGALRNLTIAPPAAAALAMPSVAAPSSGALVPPARYAQMMAYDGKRVVMFGGAPSPHSNGNRLGDTWAFSAGAWQRLFPATSPSPRDLAAMAYDGQRIVLFGGSGNGGALLNDTWAFDGATWTQLAPVSSPSPRYGAVMAYDGHRIVLFGGLVGTTPLADTWAFDGSNWTQLAPTTSPPARSQHVMAFDGQQIVVFGGGTYVQGGGGSSLALLGDTWTFDGTTWTQQQPSTAPVARMNTAFGFDGQRVVVFGGFGGPLPSGYYDYLNDAWAFQGGSWTLLQPLISPPPNYAPAMGFDGQEFVLFGGSRNGNDICAATWLLSGSSWTPWLPSSAPSARSGQGMAYDGKRVVLFGGLGNSGSLADTWVFDANGWTELALPLSPPARSFTMMAYDAGAKRAVLFGGADMSSGTALSDTWVFDDNAWTLIQTQASPPARSNAGMAYDGQNVVLFGGLSQGSTAFLNDTWVFTGQTWQQAQTQSSPSRRRNLSMALVSVQAMVFGGFGTSGDLADLWLFDGSSGYEWITFQPAHSPSARSSAALIDDGTQTLLFGGLNASGSTQIIFNDTWAFRGDNDGGDWHQLQPATVPPARFEPGIAYDPGRGLVVMFGGINNVSLGDTWTWDASNWTQWLAPVPQVPSLRLGRVTYQGGAPNAVNLNLEWSDTPQPADPYAYLFQTQAFYDVGATNPAGLPVQTQSPNSGGWTPAAAQLTLGDQRTYWIAARVSVLGQPQLASQSNSAPILRYPVTPVSMVFDGAHLDLTWVPDLYEYYTGFQVSITASGRTLVSQELGAASGYPAAGPPNAICWRFDLSGLPLPALNPVPTLSINAIAVGTARSSGPVSTASIYTIKPLILKTLYQSGSLTTGLQYLVTVLNQGYSSQTPPQFLATVSWNGTPCYGPTLLTSTIDQSGNPQITLAIPAALPFFAGSSQIPPGLALEVSLAQADSVSAGPAGPASALLIAVPELVAAAYTLSEGAGSLAVTIAYPPGQAAAQVTVWQGTTSSGTATVAGTTGLVPVTLTAGVGYTVTVQAQAGESVGPWSPGPAMSGEGNASGPGLPLISSVPALSTISIDNGLASLTWSPISDAGLSGYRVSATVDGAVVASAVFTGTSGNLTVAGDGAAFSIAGVAGSVTGPAAVPVTAVTAPPAALTSGWSSVGPQCTLQWQPPAGSGAAPDGYQLAIYDGELKVHEATVTTTSYPVPANILTGVGSFWFRVAATASATPTRTGPWSASAPIVAAAPDSLTVNYDGGTLEAAWAAVPDATGYRLVLLSDGAESGNPWFTIDAEASAALAFDSTKTYSLAVQAIGPGGITGPAATAALFGAGFYPQFATNTAPALIPAVAPAMSAFPIAIGLPQIFTSPPESLPSTAPFALSAGTAPYSYVLTIAGTAGALPWSFTADAVRADLYLAYGTFLGQLETSCATAFGIQTVQAAIARAMPQTFAETLLYAYGFNGSSGFSDLRPGMVLRVEYESYQTMGAATPNQAELNGFISTAVAEYQITRSASNATGFTALDAFIGWLTGQGGTAVTQPPVTSLKQAGGGGLIDSGYALMQQPFLRLIYPPSFPGTNQVGTPYPQFNAVLIAASKLSDLQAATNSIRGGGAPGNNVGVLYFRGRTTLTPQVRVWVNDVEQLVPLGTTVGEILAQRAMDPSAVDLPLTGLRLRRGIGPALIGSPAFYDVGGGAAVRLDWAPSGHAALTGLPVLGGDRIDLGGAGSAA